ncbi:STAS/SEC14 domain-containing protein [Arthrobacter sp. ISL-85]|uniref:DUF7793 family protein n=1 Tax=Arthrobacter sp. ISL-85 TaxID=2819115 RepID=UPI001BE93AAA|nr:STAS/SEC14 domain-containing protein [Arthrobacter sp. ISL-85]MBT2566313.1 STAS/SEC14 domain-containing protein [Arthrobacter sp. ISL-85]
MERVHINGGKGSLEVLENGVICLAWQPNSTLELDDVRTARCGINDLCRDLPRALLVEMNGAATISHDARTELSTYCAATRTALLCSTPVDYVIASFRSADSYPCPTRFFTDRSEAVEWLLEDSPISAPPDQPKLPSPPVDALPNEP